MYYFKWFETKVGKLFDQWGQNGLENGEAVDGWRVLVTSLVGGKSIMENVKNMCLNVK